MNRGIGLALLSLALGLIAWVRLTPLSLPFADAEAAREVRAEVLAEIDPGLGDRVARRAAVDSRVDAWLAANPEQAASRTRARAAEIRSAYDDDGNGGPSYVYLGDFDSYLWLRQARNVLEHGSACDLPSDDICRNQLTHAPLGRDMLYPRSLHVQGIAALHRAIEQVHAIALPTSAFLLPVVIGLIGAVPAFALGYLVGGPIGGFLTAILTGLGAVFLRRSIGADNDVWNVLLPVAMFLCCTLALITTRRLRTVSWTLLACVLIGVHASIWDGWRLTYLTLATGLVGLAILEVLDTRLGTPWTGRAALTLVVFMIGCGIAVAFAGSERNYVTLLFDTAGTVLRHLEPTISPRTLPSAGELPWPSAFAIVDELRPPAGGNLAAFMPSTWHFALGWVALPVLCLPARPIARDLVVIAAGSAAMLVALFAPAAPTIIILVGTAVLALTLFATTRANGIAVSPGRVLLVLMWPAFAAAIELAAAAQRFVMLVEAPSGIALGCALGLLHLHVSAALPQRQRATSLARTALLVVFAAAALPAISDGHALAAKYRPILNDSWRQTLESVRNATSPDTIVTSWWDFGYWVSYYAERPTTMDGASLKTQMPHWVARALLSGDETESIGILRMLACGSAAVDSPEVEQSALSRLRAAGLTDSAAIGMLMKIVTLDRGEASARLAGRGIGAAAIEDVLTRTHCNPAPEVLVLTSAMAGSSAWSFGAWDFGRAFAASAMPGLGRDQVVRALITDFGYPEPAAVAVAERAAKVTDSDDLRAFAGTSEGYFTKDWVTCDATSTEWKCPLDIRVQGKAEGFTSFRYDPLLPVTSRLVYERRGADGRPQEERQAVGTILIASRDGLTPYRFRNAEHPNLAIVVDTLEKRFLLGTPKVINSLYTKLAFLDGRYATSLRKLAGNAALGERVTAWNVPWPES